MTVYLDNENAIYRNGNFIYIMDTLTIYMMEIPFTYRWVIP